MRSLLLALIVLTAINAAAMAQTGAEPRQTPLPSARDSDGAQLIGSFDNTDLSARARNCSGKLSGTYRFYLSQPFMICTLKINKKGRVIAQPPDLPDGHYCGGSLFGLNPVIGGRLRKHQIPGQDFGTASQCWLDGRFKTKNGCRVEIFEAIIQRDNQRFSGLARACGTRIPRSFEAIRLLR